MLNYVLEKTANVLVIYSFTSKANLRDMDIYLLNYQNLNWVGQRMKLVTGTFSNHTFYACAQSKSLLTTTSAKEQFVSLCHFISTLYSSQHSSWRGEWLPPIWEDRVRLGFRCPAATSTCSCAGCLRPGQHRVFWDPWVRFMMAYTQKLLGLAEVDLSWGV